MLLCYITDRKQLPGDEATRRRLLLEKIAEAARCGVDLIQLREKDLSGRELEVFARQIAGVVRDGLRTENRELQTRLLINSRTDIAVAIGADGVHLGSDDISPSDARSIWSQCAAGTRPTIGVSCHSADDVRRAAAEGADFVLFAPVFGKHDAPETPPAGLEGLRRTCKENIPILALGGVTSENARACVDAGAAGIAGIRVFQENEIRKVVDFLRQG